MATALVVLGIVTGWVILAGLTARVLRAFGDEGAPGEVFKTTAGSWPLIWAIGVGYVIVLPFWLLGRWIASGPPKRDPPDDRFTRCERMERKS